MMPNLRLILMSAVSSALLCGFTGALIGAVAGRGTSILLPGLGLIIAGPLAVGFAVGLISAILGFILGLFVAAAIILTRRKTYP